jgi:hypothetical protein
VRAGIGLFVVGLIVVACSNSTGSDAKPAHEPEGTPAVSADATSTALPTPPLVAASAADDALLKRSELGAIIGDTDLRQVATFTKPWQSSEGVDPRDCAPRLGFNEAVGAAGYQLAVGDSNRGARGQSAMQLVTVFVDREQPTQVAAGLGRMFGYCAEGEEFSTTARGVTQHWTSGPATHGATRAGGGAQRQEAPPRNCYHAVAVRANTVVESIVCGDGDSAAQANAIVDRISAKLPD